MDNNAVVAICIVCYNQSAYIAEAIESVLAQKTDFKYRIYIGEDQSSDNTLEICESYRQKYPDIIKLYTSERNLGLVGNTKRIFEEIEKDQVPYIAILDGDDYWIDDYKLQKQYDFLQKNQDYGLIYGRSAQLKNGKIENPTQKKEIDGNIPLSVIWNIPIPNNTVLFKTELLKRVDMDDFLLRGFMSCDYAMYVVFSQFTKVKSFPDILAVCRRGHNSVSHPENKEKAIHYVKNDIAQFSYLFSYFPGEFPVDKENLSNHYDYRVFNIAFKFGDYDLAHNILKTNKKIWERNTSFYYRAKVVSASNKVFFYFWRFFAGFYKRMK